jgi:hypothetical protein
MNYNEMKHIVETIEELKSLSFTSLEDAKEWAKTNCQNLMNTNEPDFFDFDYKMLSGSFCKNSDGEIELGDSITVYDEHGEPKFIVDLW